MILHDLINTSRNGCLAQLPAFLIKEHGFLRVCRQITSKVRYQFNKLRFHGSVVLPLITVSYKGGQASRH